MKARKYSDDMIRKESLKYDTVRDFKKFCDSMYQAAVRRGIVREVCSHMEYANYPYWTDEELIQEALPYKCRVEFQKKNGAAYKAAYKRGILDLVCAHMAPSKTKPFSLEEIREAASKCLTVKEFRKKCDGEYQAAWKLGILDEIRSHMEYENYPWTDEELKIEARLFTTRGEFKEKSPAWQVARNRGLLDEACAHMKSSTGSSRQEKELFGVIKNVYSSAKKVRDMKVKIEGKPYIHGFDIDIFVPELNLGIEFDGKYHHSFEAMRADPKRAKWSDEDIHNYHDLKDEWFWTSKGIKIHHVKWDDWVADKQACIQRCLDFLGVKP